MPPKQKIVSIKPETKSPAVEIKHIVLPKPEQAAPNLVTVSDLIAAIKKSIAQFDRLVAHKCSEAIWYKYPEYYHKQSYTDLVSVLALLNANPDKNQYCHISSTYIAPTLPLIAYALLSAEYQNDNDLLVSMAFLNEYVDIQKHLGVARILFKRLLAKDNLSLPEFMQYAHQLRVTYELDEKKAATVASLVLQPIAKNLTPNQISILYQKPECVVPLLQAIHTAFATYEELSDPKQNYVLGRMVDYPEYAEDIAYVYNWLTWLGLDYQYYVWDKDPTLALTSDDKNPIDIKNIRDIATLLKKQPEIEDWLPQAEVKARVDELFKPFWTGNENYKSFLSEVNGFANAYTGLFTEAKNKIVELINNQQVYEIPRNA